MAKNESIDRRSVLKYSVGGMATLAGCSSTPSGESGTGESSAEGSEYPESGSEMTIVVPYPTGGGFDAYARIIAPYWESHLPKDPNVIVKNETGGGAGTIGTLNVYDSSPNGKKFLMGNAIDSAINHIANDDFDMMDMSHIGLLAQDPGVIVLNKNLGIDTWDDFVANIDQIKMGTAGKGGGQHLYLAALGELTGEFTYDTPQYVHYSGTGEVLAGLKRGEVDMTMANFTSSIKIIKGIEEMKMLAVFWEKDKGKVKELIDNTKVDPTYGLSELKSMDLKNMDSYRDIAAVTRYLTQAPDTPQNILKIQRNSFQDMLGDEELLSEASEADRPIINPGDHQKTTQILKQMKSNLTSSAIKELIQKTNS